MSSAITQYPNNQCLDFFQSRRLEYDSLKYRSEAEIAIAKAIDKHNRDGIDLEIYYIPNGVIVTPEARTETSSVKIESDFLIFYQGVTAVLEVDGSQHSELSVIKKDAKKECHWKNMEISVIERFSANECLESPDKVLCRFLHRIKMINEIKSLSKDYVEEYSSEILLTFYNIYKYWWFSEKKDHLDWLSKFHKIAEKDDLVLPSQKHKIVDTCINSVVRDFLRDAQYLFPISFDGYKFVILSDKDVENPSDFTEKMKYYSRVDYGLECDFELILADSILYKEVTSTSFSRLSFSYEREIKGDYCNSDSYDIWCGSL